MSLLVLLNPSTHAAITSAELPTFSGRRFARYWRYLQEYGPQRIGVLFVTTGQGRLESLMAALRSMPKPSNPPYGGKGWFRFALEGEYGLEEPRSVLSAIWRTVTNEEGRVPLI